MGTPKKGTPNFGKPPYKYVPNMLTLPGSLPPLRQPLSSGLPTLEMTGEKASELRGGSKRKNDIFVYVCISIYTYIDLFVLLTFVYIFLYIYVHTPGKENLNGQENGEWNGTWAYIVGYGESGFQT